MKIYPTFKTNAKEDFRKEYEIFDQTICADNVKRMGELIALSALKITASHCGGYYEHLYRYLLKDVFNQNKEKEHIISDGYDYAQDAILFLWHFVGKKPSDVYKIDKTGREISIKTECVRYINRKLARDKSVRNREESIAGLKVEPTYKTNEQVEEQQKKVDKTIRKMKLTKSEKDVLTCYMAGMTFVQIAKFLSVDNSTVWHRRQRLQIKYMANVK